MLQNMKMEEGPSQWRVQTKMHILQTAWQRSHPNMGPWACLFWKRIPGDSAAPPGWDPQVLNSVLSLMYIPVATVQIYIYFSGCVCVYWGVGEEWPIINLTQYACFF